MSESENSQAPPRATAEDFQKIGLPISIITRTTRYVE